LTSLEKLRAATGVRIGAPLSAYYHGLKEPEFVAGYTGPESDIALRGRNRRKKRAREKRSFSDREWLEKGLADIQASIEIPIGQRHPRFAQVPELGSFAGSAREKSYSKCSLLQTFRPERFSAPETPKERVQILREAMRKTLADPEFSNEFHKLTGHAPTPLMPEALEKAIKEMPRDADVVDLFNKLADPEPLPAR
jgi:hypothetical protein